MDFFSILLIIALFFVALLVAGNVYERSRIARDRRAYAQKMPGERIDVNGKKVRVVRQGSGTPTVVFESGVGANGMDWLVVQPRIAEFAATLSYDRLGYGWSDNPDTLRTPENIVKELRAVIEASGVEEPVVLVVHALSSVYARLYAEQYPVAGMVLVDAAHPQAIEERDTLADIKRLRRINRFRQVGILRMMLPRVIGTRVEQIPEEWQGAYLAKGVTDVIIVPDEAEALFITVQSGLELQESIGDIPLKVVTSLPLETDLGQHRHQLREKLSELSPQGENITTEKGGHYIQLSEPDYIVDAVRDVVDAVREKQT